MLEPTVLGGPRGPPVGLRSSNIPCILWEVGSNSKLSLFQDVLYLRTSQDLYTFPQKYTVPARVQQAMGSNSEGSRGFNNWQELFAELWAEGRESIREVEAARVAIAGEAGECPWRPVNAGALRRGCQWDVGSQRDQPCPETGHQRVRSTRQVPPTLLQTGRGARGEGGTSRGICKVRLLGSSKMENVEGWGRAGTRNFQVSNEGTKHEKLVAALENPLLFRS